MHKIQLLLDSFTINIMLKVQLAVFDHQTCRQLTEKHTWALHSVHSRSLREVISWSASLPVTGWRCGTTAAALELWGLTHKSKPGPQDPVCPGCNKKEHKVTPCGRHSSEVLCHQKKKKFDFLHCIFWLLSSPARAWSHVNSWTLAWHDDDDNVDHDDDDNDEDSIPS